MRSVFEEEYYSNSLDEKITLQLSHYEKNTEVYAKTEKRYGMIRVSYFSNLVENTTDNLNFLQGTK